VLARSKIVRPPTAELGFAITLFVSAVYIAVSETFANWQAFWFAVGLIALACTLCLAKDAPE
jgi:hypothetical protein